MRICTILRRIHMSETQKQFRPKLVPTLVMLVVVATASVAGLWQLGRYHEQTARVAHYHEQHDLRPPVQSMTEAAGSPTRLEQLHFRRAKLTGALDTANLQLLHRFVLGKWGYYVIAPLSVDGGKFPK